MVADYVRTASAVRCAPEQVIITNGGRHAIFPAIQVLFNPGDKVWMENPGYQAMHALFRAASAQMIPVPVDEHGLNVLVGIAAAPNARPEHLTTGVQILGQLLRSYTGG